MPFDPTKPADHSPDSSAEMRAQLNSLNDKIDALRGLNISITTSAKTDEECRALLTSYKLPFKT